ncbi:hypothetical protein FRC20_006271 [Serendipita sp. 405]|nr:hypothetical protein FRC16_009249 [Serendipita sp. 398]KAG8867237.1 hypothetical protein FRC20_006271 [Serendipita sp. 405]
MALLFTTQTLVQGILGHYVKIKANYWFPSSECCPSLPLNSPSTDRMQSIISLHSRSPFNVSPSLKPMKPGFTSLHRNGNSLVATVYANWSVSEERVWVEYVRLPHSTR